MRASAGQEVAKPVSRQAQGQKADSDQGDGRKTGWQANENKGKKRQIQRQDHCLPQGSPRQKQTPAEVDETRLNPLITRIQVESRSIPRPGERGRVSRCCLRLAASGPIPKLARARGHLLCELRNQRDTSNVMILMRFWI